MKTAHCYICGKDRGRGKMVEVFLPVMFAVDERRTVMVCPHHRGGQGAAPGVGGGEKEK
jgi:hypothetical protein